MSFNFSSITSKELVFDSVAVYLQDKGLRVDKKDSTRPWGGFFVID